MHKSLDLRLTSKFLRPPFHPRVGPLGVGASGGPESTSLMDINALKQFAVAILSETWAGADLPPEMISLAHAIRARMQAEGIWEIQHE